MTHETTPKFDKVAYMTCLYNKYTLNTPLSKKTKERNVDVAHLTRFNCFKMIHTNYFTLLELKQMCKYYNLCVSGRKKELAGLLYSHMYLSNHARCIQRAARNRIRYNYVKSKGNILHNNIVCVNDTDFATFDNIADIKYDQLFSFDEQGQTYCCTYASLHQLVSSYNDKSNPAESVSTIKNPYTRNYISCDDIRRFKRSVRLGKLLQINLDLPNTSFNKKHACSMIDYSDTNEYERRVKDLIHDINLIGHYANESWILSLNATKIYVLLKNILDVWSNRIGLTQEDRIRICPPHGVLTNSAHTITKYYKHCSIDELRFYVLIVMEKLVRSSANLDDRSLGTYYVLGCLAIVNPEISGLGYLRDIFI